MAGEVDPLIVAITRLGFTELEAASYHALLRAPASTGYRIAKTLGRPHANVYQALTALERKGAVMFEDEACRVYSAVPPAEVFDRLRRNFNAESTAVEQALESLGVDNRQQERLYHLATRDQMLARARTMIGEATECILFYAGPPESAELREPLQAAVERGVCVTGIMVREPDLIPGSKLRLSRVADQITGRWGNLPIMLAIDARELLIAELSPEGDNLGDAIWTDNRLISALFHNSVVSDIILHSLPAIETIRSPNTYLLGDVPRVLKELFAERVVADPVD